MMGDAEGDLKAAESNGIAFYPVLVNHETRSWGQLPQYLSKFIFGESSVDNLVLRKEFYSNLHMEV